MIFLTHPISDKESIATSAAKLNLDNGNGTFTFESPNAQYDYSGVFSLDYSIYIKGKSLSQINVNITLDVQG